MTEQQEPVTLTTAEVATPSDVAPPPAAEAAPGAPAVAVTEGPEAAPEGWQVRAGRKGARRVHQLIQQGKLYEQEHGLKRGRQRLRQLIELGKRYEQEHGFQPARPTRRGGRLARAGRDELLATLLECLTRLAKPSFRGELLRLTDALTRESAEDSSAA